jgi:hypothetical protein
MLSQSLPIIIPFLILLCIVTYQFIKNSSRINRFSNKISNRTLDLKGIEMSIRMLEERLIKYNNNPTMSFNNKYNPISKNQ